MFRLAHARTFSFFCLTLVAAPLAAQQTSSADDVIAKIREEGLKRSQVMQTLSYLTDVIGPRLTGSPNLKRANEWTRNQMTTWGLQNAHLEAWGPFGVGWTLERYSAQVISPQCIPVTAYPKAWSPGVRGTHTGDVVYVDATTEADLAKYKGKLKGAIVLNGRMPDVKAHFEPLGQRYTDEELERMANRSATGGAGQRGDGPRRGGQGGPGGGRPGGAPPTGGGPGGGGPGAGGPFGGGPNSPAFANFQAQRQLAAKKTAFFMEEGVAVLVDPSSRGDGGTIFVQSATVPAPPAPASVAPATPGTPPGAAAGPGNNRAPRASAWDKNAPKTLPQLVMAAEDYNRLMRMIQQGEKPKMAVQLGVRLHDKDLMAYNTVAELPGADKKDEVVMMGAHLDSWHSSTGATDNAVGCAVVMEALRILKAAGIQPRRTIRVALWTGEEQGLFGSNAYVEQHLSAMEQPSAGQTQGDTNPQPARRRVNKPDFEKFCAYFNLDNGTGKIRGVYAQGNEAAVPIFKDWLTPFKDMGATTVTIGNTGSTDHVPFDRVGLPGFQFIQDVIEYNTRTHHSNQDNYDRIQADDVKQAAIIMATFAYQAAMRDELFPRKPERTAPTAGRSTTE